jgi:hypothetical protein
MSSIAINHEPTPSLGAHVCARMTKRERAHRWVMLFTQDLGKSLTIGASEISATVA